MKLLQESYVKYGLIMLGVLATCLLLMELTGQNQSFDNKSPITVAYMFIAPAIIWYFGIRDKKKQQKGKLTYKQGVKEGFMISLVYGITSPFLFMLYYLLINPGLIDYARNAYMLTGASDAVVIALDMLVQFVAALIFGTLYAAVIAYFLKTKK